MRLRWSGSQQRAKISTRQKTVLATSLRWTNTETCRCWRATGVHPRGGQNCALVPVSCGRWERSACLFCGWASRRTWVCRRMQCTPGVNRNRSQTATSLWHPGRTGKNKTRAQIVECWSLEMKIPLWTRSQPFRALSKTRFYGGLNFTGRTNWKSQTKIC